MCKKLIIIISFEINSLSVKLNLTVQIVFQHHHTLNITLSLQNLTHNLVFLLLELSVHHKMQTLKNLVICTVPLMLKVVL